MITTPTAVTIDGGLRENLHIPKQSSVADNDNGGGSQESRGRYGSGSKKISLAKETGSA